MVIETNHNCTMVDVLNIFNSLEYEDIIVRSISEVKYLLTFTGQRKFDKFDLDHLGLGF